MEDSLDLAGLISGCDYGLGGALRCPKCGGTYLHHEAVEVFNRREDATEGTHLKVSGDLVQVDRDLDGNPSGRREGISISFTCENCKAIPTLTLAQHKGQSFVQFFDAGKA